MDPIVVFWFCAAVLTPPLGALRGLNRVDPECQTEPDVYFAAAASGAAAGAGLHLVAGASGAGAVMAHPAAILLISLLAVAGAVDFRTAWAPRELMIPICLAAGAVAAFVPNVGLHAELTGLFTGLLLYLAMHAAWVVQLRAGSGILPPADGAVLVLPALLFGVAAASAVFYGLLAAALALIGRPGSPGWLAGDPAALASAVRSRSPARGRPVALVGLCSPALILALAVQVCLPAAGLPV